MLFALTLALITSGLPQKVALPLGEWTLVSELRGARDLSVDGDVVRAFVHRDGEFVVEALRVGQATVSLTTSDSRRHTLTVTVQRLPAERLGGASRSLYRRCPNGPETYFLGLGHVKAIRLPEGATQYYLTSPELMETVFLGNQQLLVTAHAEGMSELHVLRDGQPPWVARFVVLAGDDGDWECEMCRAAPCASMFRLYGVKSDGWLSGVYRDVEEWAAYQALHKQFPTIQVPALPAEFVRRAVDRANATLVYGHVRTRVHLEGTAVVFGPAPGSAPRSPAELQRAQEVLGPQLDLLRQLATAEAPDWSFKLSHTLRDVQARAPRDGGADAPLVDVVISAPRPFELLRVLEGLGLEAHQLEVSGKRTAAFAAQVRVDRLGEVAAVGPVGHLYAAEEIVVPPQPSH